MSDTSSTDTEQAFQYESDGKIVELRSGDHWKIDARSGSGWYVRKYRVGTIRPDGIRYRLSFEGHVDYRETDNPSVFGTKPVENGTARYVDAETEQ